MFVLFAARTLALVGRIDYGAPVIQIQCRLARLRQWRTGVERPLFAIIGCFIWIPLILVIFNALGADIWTLHRQVVYWDIAIGFACLGIPYRLVQRARRKGRDAGGNSDYVEAIREDESLLYGSYFHGVKDRVLAACCPRNALDQSLVSVQPCLLIES
jgi:hypothetical protein